MKLYSFFARKREIEPMFKAADPNGDGHVSVQEGTDILIKKFPLMKPEVLQKIAKRSGCFFFFFT